MSKVSAKTKSTPLERVLNAKLPAWGPRLLEPLRQQLGKLGLSVSFWDAGGKPLVLPAYEQEFCRRICQVGRYCQDAMSQLARKVCQEHSGGPGAGAPNPAVSGLGNPPSAAPGGGESSQSSAQSPCGCCLLGVPMRRRRRLIGAVVACFPTHRTAGSEELARACSRLCLDAQYMAAACRKAHCHDAGEADCLGQVLEWLMENEQARQASSEELATLSTNLANTYEELSLLYRISGSMKVNETATQFFENLCRELLEVIQLQAVAVVLLGAQEAGSSNQDPGTRNQESGTGSREPGTMLPVSDARFGAASVQVVQAGELGMDAQQVAELARTCLLPHMHASGDVVIDNQFCPAARCAASGAEQARVQELAKSIHTLIAVPLVGSEGDSSGHGTPRVMGVVMGINKLKAAGAPDAASGEGAEAKNGGTAPSARVAEFDSVDLKLITSVTSQAAVFLENNHLYEQLQDLLMGLLHALTASIDAKDQYTCGHSRRVAMVSRRLAELSGMEARRVERVYLAGLLHDIGKIGMPETVLCKPGRLTDEEFNSVKKHPQIGATILGGIWQLRDIIPVVLCHHERPDGRGYPRGLKGAEIPLEAMIVGLADSFDAMTSSRTYRPAMALEVVASEIRRCSGAQFEPALVELLLGLDLEELLKELWEATGPDLDSRPIANCQLPIGSPGSEASVQ
jgi:GAF domain-containing protein